MNPFINYSELYNAGGSFSKQEVIRNGDTTVIYGGYAPRAEAVPATDDCPTWLIRRMVATEDGVVQTIECTWARGSWTDRATLDYTYLKP